MLRGSYPSTLTILPKSQQVNNISVEIVCKLHFVYHTGQPHEGSAYGSVKMYKTARHRLEHTRTRLQDLENLKNRALASTMRPTSAQNP